MKKCMICKGLNRRSGKTCSQECAGFLAARTLRNKNENRCGNAKKMASRIMRDVNHIVNDVCVECGKRIPKDRPKAITCEQRCAGFLSWETRRNN